MTLAPDSYVTPQIRLQSLLRMGGVGSLWTARHEGLGRDVVVKLISASLLDDSTTVARFKREGRFTAEVTSPHVVEVHEQGLTDDGMPYIVMELLQGEDLSERIARTGPLSLDELVMVIGQLCEALSETHKLGIIHRDIKLNSVFLVDQGEGVFVKLLDFGLAKAVGAESSFLTVAGAVLGSLVYMSPEQFYDPKRVDGRADLWSVGVVAYRALTNRSPFREAKGAEAILAAVRNDAVLLPSVLVPGIPPAVDAWFSKALDRDPDARFQTAREMAEALARAVAERPAPVVGAESVVRALAPAEREERRPPAVAPPLRTRTARLWLVLGTLLVCVAAALAFAAFRAALQKSSHKPAARPESSVGLP